MTLFHVVTQTCYPTPGGMEASIMRIAAMLGALPMSDVIIYTRAEMYRDRPVPDLQKNIRIIHLAAVFPDLGAPLQGFEARNEEKFRIGHLSLRAAILRQMAERQDPSHVLVSFFISGTGYIAQHVANDLGIPHIASVRGTDFSRYFRSPHRQYAIEFVVRHATAIVTTNREQERAFRKAFGIQGNWIQTIVNSHPGVNPTRTWQKPKVPGRLRIVSDCGYSFKKGTHLLFKAFERLLERDPDVCLAIVGKVQTDEAAYWTSEIERMRQTYEARFSGGDHLPMEEIEAFLLTGHLYCSASLGEGSSNASAGALVLGMPMVATRCGSLVDQAGNLSHITFAEPGDWEDLERKLKAMLDSLLKGGPDIDEMALTVIRENLSADHERNQWKALVDRITPKVHSVQRNAQKRVLFFSHDGSGLGHLRRQTRIAIG